MVAALVPLLVLTTTTTLMAAAAAGVPPFSCGPSSAEASQGYAFCDATLGPAQRAADLVSRLTPAEKVAQLGDVAPGVPRLGVPAYKWWNEALHGLATSGKGLHFDAVGGVRAATSFPQVLLTAAAFDEDLWLRIGQVRTSISIIFATPCGLAAAWALARTLSLMAFPVARACGGWLGGPAGPMHASSAMIGRSMPMPMHARASAALF
jgi:hypothetical protein